METLHFGDGDAALNALGPIGLYTWSQFWMSTIAIMSVGWGMFSVVFTENHNPFHCNSYNLTDNTSDLKAFGVHKNSTFDNTCEMMNFKISGTKSEINGSHCSAFEVDYKYPRERSFVSEFDLVCDREFMIGLTQTLLNLGNLVASLIFPYFTDRFGRRPVCITCALLSIAACIGLASSVSYTMFAVFKFIVGICIEATEIANVTVQFESTTTRYRAKIFGTIATISWSMGLFFLALIAYPLRHYSWRVLEYTTAVAFLVVIVQFFFMTETIRWLAANNQIKRLHKTLRRVSKWNNRNYKDVFDALYGDKQETVGSADHRQINQSVSRNGCISEDINLDQKDKSELVETPKFWYLFTDPILRVHTIFCVVAWFFNSLAYFALLLMSSTLHGNLYVNFALNCLAELPPCLVFYLIVDRIGRRPIFCAFSLLAGLTLIATAIMRYSAPDQHVAILVLSLLGKVGISGSFGCLYVFTNELFPTNLRNMGVGASHVGARIGGMLAPFSKMLMERVVYAPGLIFGISCLFLSSFVFVLPETKSLQYPQTRQEMRQWKSPLKRFSKEKTVDANDAFGHEGVSLS